METWILVEEKRTFGTRSTKRVSSYFVFPTGNHRKNADLDLEFGDCHFCSGPNPCSLDEKISLNDFFLKIFSL